MNRKTEVKTPEPRKATLDILDISHPLNRRNILSFSNHGQNFSREDLINFTAKLAEDARNGTLKGLGGFAEYKDGYIFGLEGSYLRDPGAAVLPLIRLQRRIMSQVEDTD